MIICRTPFRISFFGGGTDYPAWYMHHGGQVLSTSIDKYCYLTLRFLPPFFEHRSRIVYSKIESVRSYEDISHPVVRETLRLLDFQKGLEIHHDGDLPARSGMGSSSSFTVGLLHSLYALKGNMRSKEQLAREAIFIEQEVLKEVVGSQDQVAAAYGGLNHIVFHVNGSIEVRPMVLGTERIKELNDHLMLFYTGIMRTASSVAHSYVKDISLKKDSLNYFIELVDEAITLLSGEESIVEFGSLMSDAWEIKRKLSPIVSNSIIDDFYYRARNAGALGGKITGAGGGGFLLLFVPPDAQESVRSELKELLNIPFRFESNGSQIVFYDPKMDDFRHIMDTRDNPELCCFRELHSLDVNKKKGN